MLPRYLRRSRGILLYYIVISITYIKFILFYKGIKKLFNFDRVGTRAQRCVRAQAGLGV
jgi:hypothetical protein